MKIAELMTRDPIAVGPETPLMDVAATLAERRISGVPVIGERLEVLGVVSEADILVKEAGPEPRHGGILGWLLAEDRVDPRKLAARTAGQAMTYPAITIEAERPVTEAARLMTENAIKRLPVVDADGTLVGIVTRADLVRAFARTDAEIEREIRDDVLHRTMWMEPDAIEVDVNRGEVRLTGTVGRRSEAELLPRFVSRVPGVVSVESTLTWEWDDADVSPPDSDPRAPAASRHP
jgi:CBS domain-containing protein